MAVASGAAAGLVASACGTTTTATGVTPVTGIVIRAESLVSGFGCGHGATQVFKYVAVVENVDAISDAGIFRFSNVFDCFADGTFVNLPASSTGNLTFSVHIYAYNEATYDAASTGGLVNAVASDQFATAAPEFAPSAPFFPTWTTTCVATQQSNIVVLAVCGPLVAFQGSTGTDGGVTDGSVVADSAATDGSTDASRDARGDSATDAGADSGVDAGASPDAGADAGVDSSTSDAASDAGDAGTDATPVDAASNG